MSSYPTPEGGDDIPEVSVPDRESFEVEFKSSYWAFIPGPGTEYDKIQLDREGGLVVLKDGKPAEVYKDPLDATPEQSSKLLVGRNGKLVMDYAGNLILDGEAQKFLDAKGMQVAAVRTDKSVAFRSYNLTIYDGDEKIEYADGRMLVSVQGATLVQSKNGQLILGRGGKHLATVRDGEVVMGKDGELLRHDPDGEPIDLSSNYRPVFPDRQAKLDVAKAVCAMANYNGGAVYLGIADAGYVHGLAPDYGLLSNPSDEEFIEAVRKSISDTLHDAKYAAKLEISLPYPYIRGKHLRKQVCEIIVPPAKKCVYFYNDKGEEILYVRSGPRSMKFDPDRIPAYCKTRAKPRAELSVGDGAEYATSFGLHYTETNEKGMAVFGVKKGIYGAILGLVNGRGGVLHVGMDKSGRCLGLDADRKEIDEHRSTQYELTVDEFERVILDTLDQAFYLDDMLDFRVGFHTLGSNEYCSIMVPKAAGEVALKPGAE